MASSTAYELGKSSWPSQILLICRLGTGSTSSETQTLTRSKPHPYGIADTVEHAYSRLQQLYYSTSRAYIGSVCYPTIFRLCTRGSKLRLHLSLGRWIYMVLRQHWQDRPFSAAASVYISREAWETAEERQWRLQDLSLQCHSSS